MFCNFHKKILPHIVYTLPQNLGIISAVIICQIHWVFFMLLATFYPTQQPTCMYSLIEKTFDHYYPVINVITSILHNSFSFYLSCIIDSLTALLEGSVESNSNLRMFIST